MTDAAKDFPLFYKLTNHQAISCLSFVGGFIDGAGYALLYSIFTSAITGNIIAAASDIYVEARGVFPRFMVCIFIGLGALTATVISMKLRFATVFTKWEMGMILFALEAVVLFIAMVVGACLTYPNVDSWQVTLSAVITSFAMGLQNGAAMVLIPNCPATTAMTGNTVRFFIYGAEAMTFAGASLGLINLFPAVSGKPKDYEDTMKQYAQELGIKFHLFSSALIPFVIGALAGVPAARKMGFWSFFAPFLVVCFIVWTLYMGNEQAKQTKANNELGEQDGSVIVSPLQQDDTGDKFDLESQTVNVSQDGHDSELREGIESSAEDDQGPQGNSEPTLAWGYSLIEDERMSTNQERRGSAKNV